MQSMVSRRLTLSEFGELFQIFAEDAFRLETLDVYNVASEIEAFRNFRAVSNTSQVNNDWTDLVRRAVASGRRFERVHVVTLPLSAYLEFEIACGYRYSLEAGERIALVDRSALSAALRSLPDFWLFDRYIIVNMDYDEDGSFVAGILEDDPEIVRRFVTAWEELTYLAQPSGEFPFRIHPKS